MKKLRLIAVQSQKKALLEDLLKLGCVQVSESEADLEGLMNTLGDKRDEGAMERRSQQIKILNALKVLDQYAPVKKGLLTPKPEADKEEFLDEQVLRQGVEAADYILSLDGEIVGVQGDTDLRSAAGSGPGVGLPTGGRGSAHRTGRRSDADRTRQNRFLRRGALPQGDP